MYSNFVLKFYIVYELNTWSRNPTNNFTLKNCFLSTFKLTRNADKSKFTYDGRVITFDGESFWSFENDAARNIIIFGGAKSSSSHIDNQKKKILLLGEGPREGGVSAAEKKISTNFSKANTKFCLSLYYSGNESYLCVNKTDIYKFKAKDKISWYNFYLESISKYFTK